MRRDPLTKQVAVLAAAVALIAPAAASAHVTLQPDSAPAGGFTRLDVRVPNERDNKGTTKVEVQFPTGFEHASYEPAQGWDVEVARKGDFVDTITWTAQSARDAIAPGQFRDFGLSVGVPEGEPGDALTFKALQTYAGGEVVRWIGPADGEEPAPQVTLTEAEEHGGAAHSGEEEAAAPAPASAPAPADDDDGGSDTLAIVALAIGVLGLLARAAGLLIARRAPARPVAE
jgi:periplasmic copper chaperone A